MNDQISQLLTQLAAKMNVAVEHLWSVLVYQAYVSSLISISLHVFCILISIGLLIFTYKVNKKADGIASYDRPFLYQEGTITFVSVISALIAFGIIVSCLCTFSDNLTGLMNPEYHALNYLVKNMN